VRGERRWEQQSKRHAANVCEMCLFEFLGVGAVVAGLRRRHEIGEQLRALPRQTRHTIGARKHWTGLRGVRIIQSSRRRGSWLIWAERGSTCACNKERSSQWYDIACSDCRVILAGCLGGCYHLVGSLEERNRWRRGSTHTHTHTARLGHYPLSKLCPTTPRRAESRGRPSIISPAEG